MKLAAERLLHTFTYFANGYGGSGDDDDAEAEVRRAAEDSHNDCRHPSPERRARSLTSSG